MTAEPHRLDLTLGEMASLTTGLDFWTTTGIDRAGLPPIMLTDGPHGLRKQEGATDHLGLAGSVPATCFPPMVTLGSSFDRDLAVRVGAALGVEAAAQGVAVVLGPGANIKRSPLCGRNFEYVSEDPIASGVMAAALVDGIQSQGVGASVKHFVANNQETDRMRSSSEVAERPLREIYLRSFQRVVEDSQPWTIMCSYNRINGVHAAENRWLLTDVLRGEWGYAGLVVSDWGAVHDRVAAVVAGLDLEMPGRRGISDAQVVDAVRVGDLDEGTVATAAGRVVDLVGKAQNPTTTPVDVEAHHALAREAAARSIVLLKNDDEVLPLSPDTDVAVIGAFAGSPRYQGGGSSHVNATRVDAALAHIRAAANGTVAYAPGFTLDGSGDDAALRAEAVETARGADVVVLFLGLPESEESEGFDRDHIDLPDTQLALLDSVRKVNPRIAVVVSNGGVVALPFADDVPAIVEGWLLGQAGGSATADVLYGAVNPSGRLTETIPLRLEDTPSYGSFPGEQGQVHYGEGVLVGYRWYDLKKLDVAFPFGHGSSYTTFTYADLRTGDAANGDLLVTVDVTNTGRRTGREVVQIYTSLLSSNVQRAPRELKSFASVELEPGQTRSVELTVRRANLAYWDIRLERFAVEGGDYAIAAAASSRDIRLEATHHVTGDDLHAPLDSMSTVSEMLADPVIGDEVREFITPAVAGASDGLGAADPEKLLGSLPITTFVNMLATPEQVGIVDELIARANAAR